MTMTRDRRSRASKGSKRMSLPKFHEVPSMGGPNVVPDNPFKAPKAKRPKLTAPPSGHPISQ